jgi:hypothetical protein
VRVKQRVGLRESRLGALGRKLERDRRRLGLQFSLHYIPFFFCNLGFPKGTASDNESFFGEVRYLNLAVSKPDYCDDFFSRKFKEMILTFVTTPFLFSTSVYVWEFW